MQVLNMLCGSLKIQDAKITQKIAICAPLHNFTTLLGISSQLRHISIIGKKLVRQNYLLHLFSQYSQHRPTNGWDRFGSLGHPSKFQWVSHLGFVKAKFHYAIWFEAGRRQVRSWLATSLKPVCDQFRTSYLNGIWLLLHQRHSVEVTKLCTVFGRLLGWYTICTFLGALAPNRILPGAKFTLRPSLAFFYIGSVTLWHSSSGRQQKFAAWYLHVTGWPFRWTLGCQTV